MILIIAFENYHLTYLPPLLFIWNQEPPFFKNVQHLLQTNHCLKLHLTARGPSMEEALPGMFFAHLQSTPAIALGSQLTTAKARDGPDSSSWS